MYVFAYLFVVVSVCLAILPVNMCMFVDMGVFVSVGHAIVKVSMCVGVLVRMSVLQTNGVINHKICSNKHNRKGNIKLHSRSLSEKNKAESHT